MSARWAALLSLLLAGCREAPAPLVEPEPPPLRTPAQIVPPPEPIDASARLPPPRLVLEPTATVVKPPIVLAPAKPEPEPTPAPERTPPTDPSVEEAAALAWIEAAGRVEPGCLLSEDPVTGVELPSAKTLARLWTMKPVDFPKAAREVLLCLLSAPRVVGAALDPETAFLPNVATGDLKLSASDRPQGVVAGLVMAADGRFGVLVVALDPKGDAFVVRGLTYVASAAGWTAPKRAGDHRVTLPSTRPMVLFRKGREVLLVREETGRDKASRLSRELLFALTPADELMHVLTVDTAGRLDDGRSFVTRLSVVRSHKDFPRGLMSKRVLLAPDGAPEAWSVVRYTAEMGRPYVAQDERTGPLTLAEAQRLVTEGMFDDADWLITELPKAEQRTAPAQLVRARAAAGLSKVKLSEAYFKAALAAAKDDPEQKRDLGLYLIERKQGTRAKDLLRAYLDARPEAADRAAIEEALKALESSP